jgi:hypothetical protein
MASSPSSSPDLARIFQRVQSGITTDILYCSVDRVSRNMDESRASLAGEVASESTSAGFSPLPDISSPEKYERASEEIATLTEAFIYVAGQLEDLRIELEALKEFVKRNSGAYETCVEE